MERDIVDRLRAMAGPIVPNVCTDAADEIERLRAGDLLPKAMIKLRALKSELKLTDALAEIERLRAGGCARDQRTTQYCAEAVRLQAERDAFKAQADDVVEVDIDDVERVIKAAKYLGKDSIRLSARDIWRMANDKRGREEEDQPWN